MQKDIVFLSMFAVAIIALASVSSTVISDDPEYRTNQEKTVVEMNKYHYSGKDTVLTELKVDNFECIFVERIKHVRYFFFSCLSFSIKH